MSRRTLPSANVAKRFAWLAAISAQNKQSLYEERTAKVVSGEIGIDKNVAA